MDKWTVRGDGAEYAAQAADDFVRLIIQRRLLPSTSVSRHGSDVWVKANDVPQFRRMFRAASFLRAQDRVAEVFIAAAKYLFVGALLIVAFQAYISLRSGVWPGLLLHDVLAYNLSPLSSTALRQPHLSAMRDVHATLSADRQHSGTVEKPEKLRAYYAAIARHRGIPEELLGVQQWIVAPRDWLGIHRLVISFMRQVSVAGLLGLLSGLCVCIGAVIAPSSERWDSAIENAAAG